jgi:hypothetical protein
VRERLTASLERAIHEQRRSPQIPEHAIAAPASGAGAAIFSIAEQTAYRIRFFAIVWSCMLLVPS